jgi:putative ABC transport system permease protein
MNIHIDCGDKAGLGLKYLSGKAPERNNQIAVSFLNAEALGKKAGDSIVLYFNHKQKEMKITGIYQDVTSGGYTAKALYDFAELNAEKYSFTVNLINPNESQKKSDEWKKILGAGVTVDPMVNFIDQTLGGVVKQLKSIVLLIIILGSCLVMLITVLFLRLRLAKDLSEIAVLKAIGFSKTDIKKQYLIKTGGVSLAGILVGTLITNILGEKITNSALGITGLGIKQVDLIANPVIQYILCPLFLLVLILMVTWVVVRTIEKYNIISIIRE